MTSVIIFKYGLINFILSIIIYSVLIGYFIVNYKIIGYIVFIISCIFIFQQVSIMKAETI
jgi:hypothetical protein